MNTTNPKPWHGTAGTAEGQAESLGERNHSLGVPSSEIREDFQEEALIPKGRRKVLLKVIQQNG